MPIRSILAVIAGILAFCAPVEALIMVGRGNDPVRDQNWRKGSLEVANQKSRIGWWEGPPFGGGHWNFLYRGDAAALDAALTAFANIRAPELELVIRDGPAESSILRDEKTNAPERYDWEFSVWNVRSYYHLNANPTSTFLSDSPDFRRPLPPPRLVVYVGGGGSIDWDKVVVPKGLRVMDQRASAAGIQPGAGAVVSGVVYDMATAKPIFRAKVEVSRTDKGEGAPIPAVETDEDGRFTVEKLPAGVYRIVASGDGYAPLAVAYEKLGAGGYLSLDDIELAPEVSMTGTVVDDAGKPIAGATVVAHNTIGLNGMGYRLPEPLQAKTGEDGRFAIAGLPMGYARPGARAKGYHGPLEKLMEVPAKDITVRMLATGTVQGKVTTADGAAPQGQVVVELNPPGGAKVGQWGGSMYAKGDGTFEFTNVPPGEYVISARPNPGRAGAPANATKVTVTAGKVVEVGLKL